MSHGRRHLLRVSLLVAALLTAYLAGNGRVALWDRDEPRYAVTSLAMLRGGDWVVPRFLGEVRTAKPPAVYWLQAASMRVFGVGDFAVRLPGALACAAAVGVLGLGLPPVVGRRRALWAAFVLGTSVLVLGVAKVGVIDGLLLPCAALVLVGLLRLARGRGSVGVVGVGVVWVSVGIGGLLKGPILLGVLVATLLTHGILQSLWNRSEGKSRRDCELSSRADLKPTRCSVWAWGAKRARTSAKTVPKHQEIEGPKEFSRDSSRASDAPAPGRASLVRLTRRVRPVLGLAIVLLVAGPWLVAIQVREPNFLRTTVAHDLLARSTGGLEGHGRPPGFHLLCLAGTWFPWSVLLPGVLAHAWRRRGRGFVLVCLAAAVGPWVMFELVATKLPHYLLPIFPALAVLTGDWLARATRGRLRLDRRGLVAAGAIYAVVALGFGVVPWALGVGGFASGLVAVAWAAASWRAWSRGQISRGVLIAGAGMAATVAVAYATWLGGVDGFTRSKRVADALAATGGPAAILVDYKEPSLAWYALRRGVDVREADQEALADAVGLAVVKAGPQAARPAAVRARWRTVARVPARPAPPAPPAPLPGDVLVLQILTADAPTRTGATP